MQSPWWRTWAWSPSSGSVPNSTTPCAFFSVTCPLLISTTHHSYTHTLGDLVVEDRTISFMGCIMQFFSACMFAVAEAFMLAVMACYQFVAICKPPIYTVVMSPKLCASLVACPYTWGLLSSLTLTYFLQTLSSCGSNIINNFLCEHSVIVSVSCSDPFISQVLYFAIAKCNEVWQCLAIVLTTYISIFVTIIKMPSAGIRQKAFSTCAPPQADHHHHVPWDCPVPLLCTQLQKFMAHGQSTFCILYSGESHAEPPDL